jgi:8-amino-7-oxononanoate synthase
VPSWAERVDARLAAVAAAGQWRGIPDGDESVISFASNDYLGLSRHTDVVAAAHAALDRWGAGSGAARLVGGNRPVHRELEAALAEWKGEEAALLFPTGYAANLGVLSTFGDGDVRILSDERNHASIVDGCRLARAEVCVYRHGDVDHVEHLLASGPGAVVVTDTVFSMDGDVAPLDALVAVCRRRGALLVLDEAHAVLEPDPDLDGVDVLRVGTLSKALGSLGGFVAGSAPCIDLLANRARSFIFTTASPPAAVAAARAALRIVRSEEGDALRARLRAAIDGVRPGHATPIVPVLLGDEGAAMEAAAELLRRGLLVPAIRPPTVPPGTARLRIALSAAHTDAQVGHLVDALDDLGLRA